MHRTGQTALLRQQHQGGEAVCCVQEKVVKLGGIYLEGQVTSVEVQEAGSVYVAQDEKGRRVQSGQACRL